MEKESQKYKWPSPQIVEGSYEYYPLIEKLCNERYGKGYMTSELYNRWMKSPQMIQIALADGNFAGFSAMVPMTVEETMKYMGMPREDVERIAAEKPIMCYKSAAIPASYEGRGHFRALAQVAFQICRELGYGCMFASAWTYNGFTPMEKSFRVLGFQFLYRRQMLWYDDRNYTCVICKGRCKCDAMIYYKLF